MDEDEEGRERKHSASTFDKARGRLIASRTREASKANELHILYTT